MNLKTSLKPILNEIDLQKVSNSKSKAYAINIDVLCRTNGLFLC